MLNGRYPTQTGVMDNNTYFRKQHPDYVTLPQYFQQNGYATLRTGKIFHGGIDDQVSWTEGGEPAIRISSIAAKSVAGAGVRETGDEEAAPQPSRPARAAASDRIVVLRVTANRRDWQNCKLRDRVSAASYKAFFFAVWLNKPHSPPTAPKKFFDLYDVTRSLCRWISNAPAGATIFRYLDSASQR
jgi:arylsulfatase A-like enzyme